MFTGAEVDGDSGFVNLMRMKRAYFRSIRPQLMAEIDRRAERQTSFREELFDKLYTFFNRYFCESGSIYFRHLPAFSKTYERVYADGQDVALSWKTQMLYYVKSDVLVRSMPVELNEEGMPQNTRLLYFDASEVEHKKNNERKEFVFAFDEVKRSPKGWVIHFKVSYSKNGAKTRADEILKQCRKERIPLSKDELQKAIGVFQRQTEANFFINKDARGFLHEQFDLWVYQYIFQEETVFEEKRIRQIQAIKDTAYNIIDFIAQFEDELCRVWEKPKFVRNVNYVVTLDKLADGVLNKIIKHQGAKAQIKEWRELGMVDNQFSMTAIFNGQKSLADKNGASGECQFLPLDTAHFKDLELDILGCLGNLDEVLDGELVHSENWQALNSLQKRYREKVKCIHIDPPYNTKTSGFLYRNDYKHSSWLTMMDNRVHCSLGWLSDDGSFLCHIDENEYERLHLLMDNSGLLNAGTVIWDKRNPMTGGSGIAKQHEYVIFRMKTDQTFNAQSKNIKIMLAKAEAIIKRNDGVTDTAKKQYAEWVSRNSKLSGGEQACRFLDDEGLVYRDVSLRAPEPRTDKKFFIPLIHPVTGKPCAVPPNGFSRTPETLQKMIDKGEILFGSDETTQPRQKRILEDGSKYQISSVMPDARRGKSDLDKLGLKNFPYCHSVFFYTGLIGSGAESGSGNILDYFAGSGTTAHAVINLNREDGGERKYLLIEMGEYFHTVLLPRIKKVVYSKDWKDGKPVSREGSSHCLKYYTLEQYEESLKNARYEDGEQLELDSAKSPFEQYVFFGDDKLAHAVKPLKNGKLKINLHNLYPDIDIAESLSNILGKQIRHRTADTVTFEDGSIEKIDTTKMTEQEKRHFISLIKPYLWWGE
ncbi:site-specific DNA-methyltransferase [Candidatus Spongiihabitans sp.]|uniref:site-specific DNA-methyltransferase n=1 Tax=Candidatus Spongiihabitans sp. TaxID=3101308 RepID=UPI003C6F41CA